MMPLSLPLMLIFSLRRCHGHASHFAFQIADAASLPCFSLFAILPAHTLFVAMLPVRHNVATTPVTRYVIYGIADAADAAAAITLIYAMILMLIRLIILLIYTPQQ